MEINENKFIVTQMQEYLDKCAHEHDVKTKNSFWASEAELPLFDLYHRWKGTEATNPPQAEKQMMFMAAKMMELAIIDMLVKVGLMEKQEKQERIDIEREGIKISGYVDGIMSNGVPIEIKSFYGPYMAEELKMCRPKTSHLKQLAIYMDALGQTKGKLFYVDRGLGTTYEFTLERLPNGVFKCCTAEFDINDTYKRWGKLYREHILTDIEPKSEFRYKIPIDEIDWNKLSASDISKARNNKMVIGDSWEVQYSSFKDLIIQREGTCLGYTEAELAKIKELTKGYMKKSNVEARKRIKTGDNQPVLKM